MSKLYVEEILIGDGSEASPALKFANDQNTGFYRIEENKIGISSNGTNILSFDSNGFANERPGTVIESLWSLCDGSSHTLTNGTYTVQTVTSAQVLNQSYTDITGSTLSYLPPSNATKVVYRFSYSNYFVSSHSIIHNKFFIDNDEVLYARYNRGGSNHENRYTFEWVIPIGGSPDTNTGRQGSWTSLKTLKMQSRSYAVANTGNFHGTVYWDGAASNQFNMPIINILAIR